MSMQNRRKAGVMAVLFSLALAALPVLARPLSDGPRVTGPITVDFAGNSVTVGGLALAIDGDTEFQILGEDASFAELDTYVQGHPDALAKAKYNDVGGVITADEVEIEDEDGESEDDGELKGVIRVDLPGSAVTIGTTTLIVDGNTKIENGDAHITLADLDAFVSANPGAVAEGKFVDLTGVLTATKIEIKGSSSDDGDDDSEDELEVRGPVSVDLVNGTITVGTVTMSVSVGTEFKLLGQRSSLAGFDTYLQANPGAPGKGEFRDLNGVNVAREVKIYASGAPVGETETTGDLQAVDLALLQVTFAPTGGSPLVLGVDVATEIQVDAAAVSLAELAALLPPGGSIPGRVHYNPTTFMVREMSFTVPVQQSNARVTDVSSSKKTVTVKITGAGARARTLKIKVLTGVTIIRGQKLIRLKDVKSNDKIVISTFISRSKSYSPEVQVLPRR